MAKPLVLRAALFSVCALTIAACGGGSLDEPVSGSDPTTPTDPGGDPVAVDAMATDVTITSPIPTSAGGADETNIDATLYIPAHFEGDTYPLILHSHGWGGSKVAEDELMPDDTSADFFARIDRQVADLWTNGYAVISFSERGWENSEGNVRVIDPEFETQDAIAILDWAVSNPDLSLTLDAPNDPRVGAIGGSYGGGFQLLLAARDTRIDAIAPYATWHSLRESLVPQGVQKKGYIGGLCTLATTAGASQSDILMTACGDAGSPGAGATTKYASEIDQDALNEIASHGLDVEDVTHRVDALFVQGARDVLFNFNEAVANRDELAAQGGDVRLITTQGGHILNTPPANQAAQGPAFCGGVDVMTSLRGWFDEKLRGVSGAASDIPTLCLSLDDEASVRLPSIPAGGANCALETCAVSLVDVAVNASNQGPGAMGDPPEAAGSGGVFVPLQDASGADIVINAAGTVLAGVPQMTDIVITAGTLATDSVAFIGIGVQAADGGLRLIDDHVLPFQAGDFSAETLELVGVGSQLQIGDKIGVLLYGDHGQWEPVGGAGNWAGNSYSISGTVSIPVIAATTIATAPPEAR